jgi:glycosyltransferase involved in cell wall biosynthesis
VKILHVVPNPFFVERGGIVRVREQVRLAMESGAQCHVACYHHGANVPGAHLHRIPPVPWYTTYAPGANFHRLYLDALLTAVVFFAGVRVRPDVIHAHLHEGVMASLPLSRLFSIPVLLDAEGSLSAEMAAYRFPASGLFSHLERYLNRRAGRIVASTSQLLDFMRSSFGVPADAISLLADCIDTTVFSPRPPDADLAKQLGIKIGGPVAIYLGTLNELQGTDLLLDVIPMVNARVPDAQFLVCGFPNEKKWEAECRRRGIKNVLFPGRIMREQAPRYLSLASVALAPKRAESREGNGKVLDYMAMGLPVAAFDSPANRELLGISYPCVKRYDTQAFADRIVALFSDSTAGAMLRERACGVFSASARKQELMGIYQSMINEHKTRQR